MERGGAGGQPQGQPGPARTPSWPGPAVLTPGSLTVCPCAAVITARLVFQSSDEVLGDILHRLVDLGGDSDSHDDRVVHHNAALAVGGKGRAWLWTKLGPVWDVQYGGTPQLRGAGPSWWTQRGFGCSKLEGNHLKVTPKPPHRSTGEGQDPTGEDSPQASDLHTLVALDILINLSHLEDKKKRSRPPSRSPCPSRGCPQGHPRHR